MAYHPWQEMDFAEILNNNTVKKYIMDDHAAADIQFIHGIVGALNQWVFGKSTWSDALVEWIFYCFLKI